jgi:hypothetical protein
MIFYTGKVLVFTRGVYQGVGRMASHMYSRMIRKCVGQLDGMDPSPWRTPRTVYVLCTHTTNTPYSGMNGNCKRSFLLCTKQINIPHCCSAVLPPDLRV